MRPGGGLPRAHGCVRRWRHRATVAPKFIS